MRYKIRCRNAEYVKENKVPAIKAFRGMFGVGLKEAKDSIEKMMENEGVNFDFNYGVMENFSEYLQSFKAEGFDVEDMNTVDRSSVLSCLEELSLQAVESHDFDIATDLISVLRKYV